MRGLIVIMGLALDGCAATLPPSATYTPIYDPFAAAIVREHALEQQHQLCLNTEINRATAERYPGANDALNIAPDEIAASAISQCIPGLGGESHEVQEVVREDVFQQAMSADGKAMWAWGERRQKIISAKTSENLTKLKAEEPVVIAAWHTCTTTTTRQLAQDSQEPAEAVARAAFAACRSQRENLIELHRRYGDTEFDARLMDEAERRLTSSLMLEVMQTRSIRAVPEPPSKQPAVPSGPGGLSI